MRDLAICLKLMIECDIMYSKLAYFYILHELIPLVICSLLNNH